MDFSIPSPGPGLIKGRTEPLESTPRRTVGPLLEADRRKARGVAAGAPCGGCIRGGDRPQKRASRHREATGRAAHARRPSGHGEKITPPREANGELYIMAANAALKHPGTTMEWLLATINLSYGHPRIWWNNQIIIVAIGLFAHSYRYFLKSIFGQHESRGQPNEWGKSRDCFEPMDKHFIKWLFQFRTPLKKLVQYFCFLRRRAAFILPAAILDYVP